MSFGSLMETRSAREYADFVLPSIRPGERVAHATLGEGIVVACDAGGKDAKATVRFYAAGEKRVVARFLSRA